jgi:hypothetical protein
VFLEGFAGLAHSWYHIKADTWHFVARHPGAHEAVSTSGM